MTWPTRVPSGDSPTKTFGTFIDPRGYTASGFVPHHVHNVEAHDHLYPFVEEEKKTAIPMLYVVASGLGLFAAAYSITMLGGFLVSR